MIQTVKFLSGPAGFGIYARLLARQYENDKAFADCELVPDDLINFQHDPLACAVSLGEADVEIEELPIEIEEKGGWLVERVDPKGKPSRVVTKVDGRGFSQLWLDRVSSGGNGATLSS